MKNNPINIGKFITPCKELMYVLYMPIRLNNESEVVIPKSLEKYRNLVEMALNYEGANANGKYIYLTVKRLWVEPKRLGGRLGWHTDGFGTDDINYIWVDKYPTYFCNQEFILSTDHNLSMKQMNEQAKEENIVQYPECDVIRVDPRNVHKCPENIQPCWRAFARVSISDNKYNLIGNAHNYDLDYNWIMHPRVLERNTTKSMNQ